MALKIITQSEPIKVNNLTICLYAPPGYGIEYELGEIATHYTTQQQEKINEALRN